MWSLTQSSQSISRRHMAFFSGASGSSLHSCPKIVAASARNGAGRPARQSSVPSDRQKASSRANSNVSDGQAQKQNVAPLTAEVGDGVGDGERGADAIAAAGHVLAEEELREALLHHVDLWRTQAPTQRS
jgi:hypothetical protein